jgi:hypothetical protein
MANISASSLNARLSLSPIAPPIIYGLTPYFFPFGAGGLTGKSKQMIANEYGEAQLKKWRRGFKIRPPPVSSYSFNYPGNDYKRTKYVKDIPISLSETINRSIEARKFQIHRKFPK